MCAINMFLFVLFLPLVNKGALLAYNKAEYSKVRNPSRDRGRRKVKREVM